MTLELRARLLGEDDQGAVGHAVQAVEHRDLAVVLLPRGREHDLEVPLEQRLRGAVQDPGEVRREDERDDDADEPGAPAREAPGAAVRRIAVLADDAADQVARVVRDIAAAVENTRYRGNRHARLIRDLTDGGAVRRSLRHISHSSMFRNVPEGKSLLFGANCGKTP